MSCHVDDHEECQTVQQGKGHLRANPFFLSKVLIKENLLSCCGKRLIKTLLYTCPLKANNREQTMDLRATNYVSELTEGLFLLSANGNEWRCVPYLPHIGLRLKCSEVVLTLTHCADSNIGPLG